MKRKIFILIPATIIVGITIFLRIIFVCNGDVFENILYKSNNILIQQVQEGNRNLIILGSGYSLSINHQNKVVHHDPLMILPDIDFQEETVVSIFYPFESNGLEDAGKELSTFINSIAQNYDTITFIGLSKCGACFANAVKWVNHKNITIVTISTPFYGTPMADKEIAFQNLNWYEELVCTLIFSNHIVDQDIIPNSKFIRTADFSGLENCTHINIVSECPKKGISFFDMLLVHLNKKAKVEGDGIVPKSSQQALCYPNTIEIEVEATHATSLKLGIEKAKKFFPF